MEEITCDNAIRLALAPQVSSLTIAARAHVVYCPSCSKRFEQFMEGVLSPEREKAEESLVVKPLYGLVVRFTKDVFEVVKATGDLFGGIQLQPAAASVRGPRGKFYRDFIRMSQQIDRDLSVQLRLSKSTERGKSVVSVFIYRVTNAGIKEGVKDIEIQLCTEKGELLTSKMTPLTGVVELARLAKGSFVIKVSDIRSTVGEIGLELRSLRTTTQGDKKLWP